jgi:N-acetylmuramoyl-L-alanine amidase
MSGAHTKGHNRNSLGVCFVGNFDDVPPPELQWNKGLELVRWLLFNYGLTPENVHGHNEFASYKSCPGKMFDMDKFRNDLHMGGN